MTSEAPAAVQTAERLYTDLRLHVAALARANNGTALEDHLRRPIEVLVISVAEDLGYPKFVLAGEIPGAVAGARPDYTVTRDGLIIGHIELKAPGAGVDPDGFTGHNFDQWQQLRHLPNLLYTDGIDWILWQDGQQVARATAWTAPGKGIVGARIDAGDLVHLLDAFCANAPRPPATAQELARTTARLCRVLRNQIVHTLEAGGSEGLAAVAEDWRSLLFPEASDAEFADAYAQTITFGLIAARAAGAGLAANTGLTAGAAFAAADGVAERVAQATSALDADVGLIPTALKVLCAESAIGPIEPAVESLLSLLAATDPALLNDAGDWLYFYEDFLAQYDPELRKESGSYYTPAELVKFMVRLGAGAVAGALRNAAERLVGFELQTGPYSTATPVMVAIGNPPYRERAKGLGGWVESGNPSADQDPILDDWKPPAEWGVGAHVYNMSNLLVYFWRWATWKVLEDSGNDGGESPGVVCLVTTAAWLSGDGFQQMRAWLRRQCSEIWVASLSPEGHRADIPTLVFTQVQHEIAVVCAVRSPRTDDKPATVWFREVAPGTRSAKFAELETIGIGGAAESTWSRCPLRLRAPFKPAGEEVWRSCPSMHDLLPWSSPGVLANRGWPTSPDSDTLMRRWGALVSEPDSQRKRELFKETRDRNIDRVFANNLSQCREASGTPLSLEVEPCPAPMRLAMRSFDRHWIVPDIRVLDTPRPPLWEARSNQQIHLTCIQNDHPRSGPAVTLTHLLPALDHYHGRGGRARSGRAGIPALARQHRNGGEPRTGFARSSRPRARYERGGRGRARVHRRRVCAPGVYGLVQRRLAPHPGPAGAGAADGDYWSMAVGIGRRVVWAQTFGERCIDAADGRPAGRVRLVDGPRLRRETGEGAFNRTLSYDTERRELRIGDGVFANVAPEVHGYEVSGRKVIRSWFNYRRAGTGSRDPNSLESITPDGWRPEWDIELLDILNALTALVALEPEQAELLAAIIDGPQVTVEDLTAAEVLPVPSGTKKAPAVPRKPKPGHTTLG